MIQKVENKIIYDSGTHTVSVNGYLTLKGLGEDDASEKPIITGIREITCINAFPHMLNTHIIKIEIKSFQIFGSIVFTYILTTPTCMTSE